MCFREVRGRRRRPSFRRVKGPTGPPPRPVAGPDARRVASDKRSGAPPLRRLSSTTFCLRSGVDLGVPLLSGPSRRSADNPERRPRTGHPRGDTPSSQSASVHTPLGSFKEVRLSHRRRYFPRTMCRGAPVQLSTLLCRDPQTTAVLPRPTHARHGTEVGPSSSPTTSARRGVIGTEARPRVRPQERHPRPTTGRKERNRLTTPGTRPGRLVVGTKSGSPLSPCHSSRPVTVFGARPTWSSSHRPRPCRLRVRTSVRTFRRVDPVHWVWPKPKGPPTRCRLGSRVVSWSSRAGLKGSKTEGSSTNRRRPRLREFGVCPVV